MIVLYIIGAILLLILGLLFLPIDLYLKFKEEFVVRIRFSGVKVFPFNRKKAKAEEKTVDDDAASDEEKSENEIKGLFSKLKEKYGFFTAVKMLLRFFNKVLSNIKPLLRHIKFKKVHLNLAVASGNAATTAIEYGVACSMVYPILSVIENVVNIDYKSINVKSDFEGQKPDFNFDLTVRMNLFYLGLTAIKVLKDYKDFKARIETNE